MKNIFLVLIIVFAYNTSATKLDDARDFVDINFENMVEVGILSCELGNNANLAKSNLSRCRKKIKRRAEKKGTRPLWVLDRSPRCKECVKLIGILYKITSRRKEKLKALKDFERDAYSFKGTEAEKI